MVVVDDDLIVCTRHRPRELRECLETICAQTRIPRTVIVVDSSDDDYSEQVVRELRVRWSASSSLVWIASAPGLVHQRIVGLSKTTHPIVHFVDDDTLLDPGYVAGVLAVFAADAREEIGGVGGYITNQPERRCRRIDERLGLDSRREGVVLPSGRNVRVYGEPPGLVDVDWLPGCAMSYRRSVVEKEPPQLPLDPALVGEDVEWSYRVSRHHRLVVTPGARVVHLESPKGRRRGAELVHVELVSRWHRVNAGTGHLSRRAFWISAWGQLIVYGITAIVTVSRHRWAVARGTTQGIREIFSRHRR